MLFLWARFMPVPRRLRTPSMLPLRTHMPLEMLLLVAKLLLTTRLLTQPLQLNCPRTGQFCISTHRAAVLAQLLQRSVRFCLRIAVVSLFCYRRILLSRFPPTFAVSLPRPDTSAHWDSRMKASYKRVVQGRFHTTC
jgi:hypothetical protein